MHFKPQKHFRYFLLFVEKFNKMSNKLTTCQCATCLFNKHKGSVGRFSCLRSKTEPADHVAFVMGNHLVTNATKLDMQVVHVNTASVNPTRPAWLPLRANVCIQTVCFHMLCNHSLVQSFGCVQGLLLVSQYRTHRVCQPR